MLLFILMKELLRGSFAMPLYALATIPLIRRLLNNVIYAWYANDASACGEITVLGQWLAKLSILGL